MTMTTATDNEYAAVTCLKDGQVFLTEEEYLRQLERSNERWMCPKCGEEAFFDDYHFEEKHLVDEGKP